MKIIPFAAVLLPLLLAGASVAHAHGGAPSLPVPVELSAGTAPVPGAELKFADIFRLPVGPKGLEPSARLLLLAGRTVRLVGYMASAERPMPGRLVLAPLPVSLGDEDESLSDDLPATAVFVHLSPAYAARVLPNLRGLLQLGGTLRVGAVDEADGHVSSLQLELDDTASRRLVDAADRAVAAHDRPHPPRGEAP